MSERNDEKSLLLDHNYDGIQELDHPLPRWWIWLFYLTIIFSVFYMVYYIPSWGPTLRQELAADMKQISEARAQNEPPPDQGPSEDSLLALAADPAKVENGKAAFVGKCAACHGDQGQGGIGPNLVDDYWIHGTGKLTDIATVVSQGVADKGMPPWGAVLTPEELGNVVAFIRSIRGTNPPNAKEPQGQQYGAQ